MVEPRNQTVQVRRFGGPDGLDVIEAPNAEGKTGEVRIRVLASGLEYTDVTSGVISTHKRRRVGGHLCWDMIFTSRDRPRSGQLVFERGAG